jgi:hypothetical protein
MTNVFSHISHVLTDTATSSQYVNASTVEAANAPDCPPILAGRDASEPSDLVVSVVRGYN